MKWNFTDDNEFTENEKTILDLHFNEDKTTRELAKTQKTNFKDMGKLFERAMIKKVPWAMNGLQKARELDESIASKKKEMQTLDIDFSIKSNQMEKVTADIDRLCNERSRLDHIIRMLEMKKRSLEKSNRDLD